MARMVVESPSIPDPLLLCTPIFRDARGFFSETCNTRSLAEAGISAEFVQDNHSLSVEQASCSDCTFRPSRMPRTSWFASSAGRSSTSPSIRRGWPIYGRHVAVTLSAENWQQLWVPKGFAHGFCTLEPNTEVIYKVTDFYDAGCDRGIAWDDPGLGIAWPVGAATAVLSDKDKRHRRFSDLPAYFTHAK